MSLLNAVMGVLSLDAISSAGIMSASQGKDVNTKATSKWLGTVGEMPSDSSIGKIVRAYSPEVHHHSPTLINQVLTQTPLSGGRQDVGPSGECHRSIRLGEAKG